MAYYSVQSMTGVDFICTVRDHSRRAKVDYLVRATDERLARLEFKGERGISVVCVRPKP